MTSTGLTIALLIFGGLLLALLVFAWALARSSREQPHLPTCACSQGKTPCTNVVTYDEAWCSACVRGDHGAHRRDAQ